MLCTGDMGFGARKTHDLEVWFQDKVSIGKFRLFRFVEIFKPDGCLPDLNLLKVENSVCPYPEWIRSGSWSVLNCSFRERPK